MDPDKIAICKQLAACILRAERDYPNIDPRNDFYWHTREAAGNLARQNGIGLIALIGKMHQMDKYSPKIDQLSNPFWDQVVHPFLLCKKIVDS